MERFGRRLSGAGLEAGLERLKVMWRESGVAKEAKGAKEKKGTKEE